MDRQRYPGSRDEEPLKVVLAEPRGEDDSGQDWHDDGGGWDWDQPDRKRRRTDSGPGPGYAAEGAITFMDGPQKNEFDRLKAHGNGNRTWSCEKGAQVCGGQAQTRMKGPRTVVQQVTLHAHLPTPDKAVVEQVRAKARAAASQQPDATAANMASAALAGASQASLAAMPATTNLKRACWRTRLSEQNERLKSGGQACSTLEVLTVPETLKQVDGEEFLAQWGCSGRQNFDFLATADVWLADGAFRIAPAPFFQAHTVHGYQNGYVAPCCYRLLADKKMATYKRAWGAVLQLLSPEGPGPTLLLDYEKASYQAASAVFHEINVGGCYFHFRAAVHERAVDLGLSNRYGGNAEFRLRVGELCALAFLPADPVADWFETLAAEFPNEELELVLYFEKTWVGEGPARARARKAPVFPVDIWNIHHRTLDKKFLAASAAELFHRHHAAQFHRGAHPTYPTFILSLHKQQRITSRDITEIAMGGEKKLREPTRVRGDKQCNLVNEYLGGKGGVSLVTQLAHLAMSEE
ncbi:unnamed protein product [Prorocentrum cordatum]|uniref:MULE transposase domain-containing protein n=1 Tax=Prorocentrum cordatum TaxID=2364126 RepID=A0ABN9UEG9_9DINO|nr:unnamed protein product [Polarella glacialis]